MLPLIAQRRARLSRATSAGEEPAEPISDMLSLLLGARNDAGQLLSEQQVAALGPSFLAYSCKLRNLRSCNRFATSCGRSCLLAAKQLLLLFSMWKFCPFRGIL
jgi:hypothetical protein